MRRSCRASPFHGVTASKRKLSATIVLGDERSGRSAGLVLRSKIPNCISWWYYVGEFDCQIALFA